MTCCEAKRIQDAQREKSIPEGRREDARYLCITRDLICLKKEVASRAVGGRVRYKAGADKRKWAPFSRAEVSVAMYAATSLGTWLIFQDRSLPMIQGHGNF